jgi:hypothetical protein
MTDEQWSVLTRWLKVPNVARQPIENELDIYSRFAYATATPPSETRQNLERATQPRPARPLLRLKKPGTSKT